MNSPLTPTGTAQLLTLLDQYVPDAFINEHWNRRPKRGPNQSLSATQLWRLHLLAVLTTSHSFNQLVALLPEQRSWREFARLAHRHCGPGVRMLNEFRSRVGVGGLRAINDSLRLPLIEPAAGWSHTGALIDATDLPAACCGFKEKETQRYTAHRAALGGRTLKTGQSRCFVGYKKHTLRLWWREHIAAVLLVPLVSWVAPANVSESGFLVPSLRYCERRWSWWPQIVVADMGYLAAEAKAICRKCWRVAVVTKLKVNMNLVPPYVAPDRVECHQGQPLRWLEYAPLEDRHWFGVSGEPIFCQRCWEASRCGREFAFAPGDHETLLGLLPLVSLPAQRLLQQVRPWIEPTQSYEKNQLGLSQVFFNSLHLTWCMALLADAAVLLRAHALLHAPIRQHHLLQELASQQAFLDLHEENPPEPAVR